MKIWVLTTEVNAYDQYGEYFVCVFASKPTFHEVKAAVLKDSKYIDKSILDVTCGNLVRNGGGRIDDEDCWYFLREVETSN